MDDTGIVVRMLPLARLLEVPEDTIDEAQEWLQERPDEVATIELQNIAKVPQSAIDKLKSAHRRANNAQRLAGAAAKGASGATKSKRVVVTLDQTAE